MVPNNLEESKNLILRSLDRADRARLAPHLKRVDLPSRTPMVRPNTLLDTVTFLEHGLASTLARGQRDRQIEIAVIGREGMTGSFLALGADRTTDETFMQMPGSGLRMPTGPFREALAESSGLRSRILLYIHSLMSQTGQTALSNGRARLAERLSRWLLMCHDRSDDDHLRLTHEFLALMLGVRRVGVTVAINQLAGANFVSTSRGRIEVLDRAGLEAFSNGSYGVSEGEYLRLMELDGSFRSALAV